VDYDRSVKVVDVQKEEVVILKNSHSTNHVYGISIRGTGNIDGEASISLILNGEPYKTEMLKGKVRFDWGGDWYSDTAEIRYKPNNVNSGELLIEYKFST
jgi:hypothetical protein